MKRFEAQHVFGDPFDETMILFENVVEVFDLKDLDQLVRTGKVQDRVDGL